MTESIRTEGLAGLRHRLHSLAELSGREVQTGQFLVAFLKEHTSFEICERENWFYVRIPAEPPKEAEVPIAFRAELDALPIEDLEGLSYASATPGVSHRCGHDGHMAALTGLALYLQLHRPHRDVYLIYQPAEEIGAGGRMCAELITEKGIGEVYACHNLPGFKFGSVVYRKGLTQPSSEGFTIELTGRYSHAAEPEKGNNPSPVLAELIGYANALAETKNRDGSMSLCTIVYAQLGSPDFGVNAGEAQLGVTLRAEKEENLMQMERSLRDRAQQLCEKAGLTCDFRITDFFPETRNDRICLERVVKAAAGLGYECLEMPELWRASEDFGYYTKACPGAIFYLGAGEKTPMLHTEGYDFNDGLLERIVRMFIELIG